MKDRRGDTMSEHRLSTPTFRAEAAGDAAGLRMTRLQALVAAAAVSAGLPAVARAQTEGLSRTRGRGRTTTFAGRVEGTDAYIAIVADSGSIAGYLCDDGSTSLWLGRSRLDNGEAPLRAVSGDRVGSVTIAGNSATGTIDVDGGIRSFEAARVRERANAGLYAAVGKQPNRLLVAGWILLPDGSQRGAVAGVDTTTLGRLDTTAAPRVDADAQTVEIGGTTELPPAPAEPVQLVVIAIIAILVGLLMPAIQR
jgi:hypothetical protein